MASGKVVDPAQHGSLLLVGFDRTGAVFPSRERGRSHASDHELDVSHIRRHDGPSHGILCARCPEVVPGAAAECYARELRRRDSNHAAARQDHWLLIRRNAMRTVRRVTIYILSEEEYIQEVFKWNIKLCSGLGKRPVQHCWGRLPQTLGLYGAVTSGERRVGF